MPEVKKLEEDREEEDVGEEGDEEEWEEEDRRIFRSYLQIMKDVHPGKNVGGVFAFIDQGTVEAIG
jgi:hypothetical protein